MNHRQPFSPIRRRSRRRWWAAGALLSLAAGAGLYVWMDQQARDTQRWLALHEEARQRRGYTSDALPCTLQFTRGHVRSTTAYAGLTWPAGVPELVGASDDTEGETWAELRTHGIVPWADLDHPLLAQRLRALWFSDQPSALATLRDAWQTLHAGRQGDWQVQLRWLPTPWPPAGVIPPSSPSRVSPPADWADLDPSIRLAEALPEVPALPWTWVDLEAAGAPRELAQRWWREQERAIRWQQDPQDQSRARERWQQMHHHVYVAEALRTLPSGASIMLRRFGRVLGAHTLHRAAAELGAMMREVRCTPAP